MTARKVMLLGEIGVGKSSLARRLVFDRFEFDYKPTIGVDVYRYEVEQTPEREGLTLIIWDTDGNFGEALFKHIYMKQAAAALIVGDLSRAHTLTAMESLGRGFTDMFPGRHVEFIANKSDLIADPHSVVLPPLLAKLRSGVTHTSAKSGSNVSLPFTRAADAIVRRHL